MIKTFIKFFKTFFILKTAAVELQINEEESWSPELLVAFVSTTCLLVATAVTVKMICSIILPQVACWERKDVASAPHDQILGIIHFTSLVASTG